MNLNGDNSGAKTHIKQMFVTWFVNIFLLSISLSKQFFITIIHVHYFKSGVDIRFSKALTRGTSLAYFQLAKLLVNLPGNQHNTGDSISESRGPDKILRDISSLR